MEHITTPRMSLAITITTHFDDQFIVSAYREPLLAEKGACNMTLLSTQTTPELILKVCLNEQLQLLVISIIDTLSNKLVKGLLKISCFWHLQDILWLSFITCTVKGSLIMCSFLVHLSVCVCVHQNLQTKLDWSCSQRYWKGVGSTRCLSLLEVVKMLPMPIWQRWH